MPDIPGFANRPKQADLPIQFVVVGGGITGFATAIALRRVGHNVVVLEKDADVNRDAFQTSGACRMPPNLSKILYHWGLAEQLRSIGAVSGAINIFIQETGELLGSHTWDEEVLRETRGEFVFANLGELRALLYKTAVAVGAHVYLNAPAETVDSEKGVVKLSNGERLQGDVILGCDGLHGLTRMIVMNANDEEDGEVRFDLSMYSATVPNSAILEDNVLKPMLDREIPTLFTWFGNQHAVLGIPMGGPSPSFGMYAYCPRDPNEATWNELADVDGLTSALENSEPMLQRLASLATDATCACVSVDGRPPLEEWVDNRLVLMGASVHAMPPGSIQECALTVEDGAVLAKLFSHLHSKDQIQSFLYAFQDLRRPRCASVYQKEAGIVQYMTVPPGDFQEMRDDSMRAKRDAGKGILEAVGDLEETPEWTEIKEVFGYDAEDEADNWWVEWGLLRERARTTADAGTQNALLTSVQVSHSVTH